MKLKIWLDSGANHHSCREEEFEFGDELGCTEEEWDTLTEEEQEAYARELAFQWSDWGFTKVE